MKDKALKLLGLMRRANAIELGADRAADVTRSGKARLVLLAADAGENAAKKADNALYGHSALRVELPFTRSELSEAVGVGDCTMAAITDIGFAEAFIKLLAEMDAEKYAEAASAMTEKHDKMLRRKAEKGKKGQSKSNGKRRTNI